ncbi:hypothetical protein [Lysinibacillus sp. 54212]|uniref:hypothetical protein n=1 Tax=Lysinibacillus sp. 54212 TaxID=3119829 RepID=UPI002FCCA479
MSKLMISHAMSVIASPFIFSFSLAFAFGVYYKDFSNIFEGVPFIAFQTYIIYLLASPLLVYVFYQYLFLYMTVSLSYHN